VYFRYQSLSHKLVWHRAKERLKPKYLDLTFLLEVAPVPLAKFLKLIKQAYD
jgi:hypothetical protein